MSSSTPPGTTNATPGLATLTIRTPARAASVPARTPTSRSGPVPGLTSSGGAPRTVANGLSASARRLRGASVTNTATPHARRAIEVFKGRRTAIFNTPGARRKTAAGARRRASQGGPDLQKDGPFDALRHLSRRLAPMSERVVTSSSPGGPSSAGGSEPAPRDPSGIFVDDDDDDDDLAFISRRPRLSLPIDAGDDDEAELRPPRTSGLDMIPDDTAVSIEVPRRAVSEQPFRRAARDRDSLRMSDYFAEGQEDFTMAVDQDDSIGPIPPAFEAEDNTMRGEDDTYERFESPVGRRDTMAAGRQSDFGTIEVPMDADSPFRLEPELRDSSVASPLPAPDFDDGQEDGGGGLRPSPPASQYDLVSEDFAAAPAVATYEAGAVFDGAGEDPDDYEDIEDDDAEDITSPAKEDPSRTTRTTAYDRGRKKKAGLKVSKYGLPCPSLPPAVVKRLAETMAWTSGVGNPKISPETLQVLMQATEWFFEQLGDDLRALAHHAGRKTIEQSDVVTLMKRQRLIDSQTTLFSLAQRHLPRELLQELRVPVRAAPKKRRRPAVQTASDDDDT